MALDPNQADEDLFRGTGDMPALMRAHDWSATPLGPPATWPESLRSSLSICVGSRFPIAIYWGGSLSLLYNDAWSPILGSKHPKALGRPAIDVWPEIWDTIGPLFAQVMASGEATYAQDSLLAMRRHGYTEECYFNYTFTPIRGRAGTTEGVFNAVLETTYRIIAERRTQRLRALAERLAATRSMQDVGAEAAAVLEASAIDVPFAAIYVLEASIARLLCKVRIPDGAPAAESAVRLGSAEDDALWKLGRASEGRGAEVVPVSSAHFGRPPPGGPWPEPATSAIVAPLSTATGQLIGFIVVGASPRRVVDADYRRFAEQLADLISTAILAARAFEDERTRADQLAALDHAKTTFFNNVSHELRTPLTLILGPLEDALRSPERSLSGPALEVTQRNALRLLKLVNTILDFSRIEAGRAQASYVETDLAAFTREIASAFELAVRQSGLELTIDCSPVEGPVYVDRDMWEKLVLNLLSNALKFTFEGSIGLTVGRSGEHATLEVADTGIGIPAEELPHVFDRFHRVSGARSRTHEGSGIGLALVSEIARMHGGNVDVKSTVGRGSVFTVRIPIGEAHLPRERVDTPATRTSTALGATPFVQEALRWLPAVPSARPPTQADPISPPAGAEAIAGAHVLVADDNADMREYLQHLLSDRWSVEVVTDGQAALVAAHRRVPDLVLTDVMMPRLDGFGLLRAMRGDAKLENVPIIMLSARAGEDARIEGLGVGADDYLVKPFSSRELVARVAAQLQLARLRRAVLAERDKLHRLFVQSPVPIVVFSGRELRFELVSPSYVEMVGRADLVGKTMRECFPDVPQENAVWSTLERAYATGETVAVDEMYVPLRASAANDALVPRWFKYVAHPLKDDGGPPAGLMVAVIDVTTQVLARNAIEAARREAERYQAMLTSAQRAANIGIFDWDLRTRKVHWSPELHALMGISPGEVEPMPENWNARVHPDDVAEGDARFRQACVDRRATVETEQRMMLPDGRTRWVRVSNHISYDDASGEPVRVIGALVDIQDLKELVEQERAARAQAEEASRAKDDFLAMLGHELRNPLAPIMTALHLVRSRGIEDIHREVDVIERQAQHLVRLVDDLLDVSRVARGKVTLTRESTEIADLVASAIETASPVIESARHTLVTNVAKQGLLVEADRMRMVQVIANLLTNAAKYTPPGGRIGVTATRAGAEVLIEVNDNGSGISAELLPKVFDLFVQDRQTLARSQGGLGLGLTIVKSLVVAHGGTVTAASEGPGRGSCFTIHLPALDAAPVLPAERTSPPAVAPQRGRRVLIVDDNQDSAEMLSTALDMFGYQTATANDGLEALRIANELEPHAALLDIGLPVMDGYELAERLNQRFGEKLTLVAITGYGQDADRQRSRDAGFHEHLTKPVDFAKLAALLERRMGG